jgi:hypothetical protein
MLERFHQFRVCCLLAMGGSRDRKNKSGHFTDVLCQLSGDNPLQTKGLRTMFAQRIKCMWSKSNALFQTIRSIQAIMMF